MDEKTLNTLDFPKILRKIESHTAFRPSAELALSLKPLTDPVEILQRQNLIQEAVRYLNKFNQASIGSAHDIRQTLELARHEGVATPQELLDVKDTLIAARTLVRAFDRLQIEYPRLSQLVLSMKMPSGLIEAITLAISEHGEILDSASPALAAIRSELKTIRGRLLSKLQQMISDPAIAPILQEGLITQRDGRYVIPIRTDFKGRIPAIVHDQSASGATLFIEPLNVVELNNQNRQLQLEERDEERRILSGLTQMITSAVDSIEGCLSILAQFDLILACAKYAIEIDAVQPQLIHPSLAESLHKQSPYILQFVHARHPLLDPQKVVPINIELTHDAFALVITGPNTGGKTVALKSVGLLTLMAQAGLPIPVQSARLNIFENIFADIGDEQSIEQSLSTFSGHVKNIIHILKHATPNSLVILDELGAGTDPQEGAALARAILSDLIENKIPCLVTTHHPELKVFAHVTQGAINASVEFDIETLQPTYHLSIGLPGRSNAIAIAQRLGMPEEIIQKARRDINPSDLESQYLLDEIQRHRELARQAYQQAELERKEAEKLRQELSQRLENIENERLTILESTQREADQLLAEMKDELRKIRREAKRSEQLDESIQQIPTRITELENIVATKKQEKQHAESMLQTSRPLKIGNKVKVRSLGIQGTLSSINGELVEVQAGRLRFQTDLQDVVLLEEQTIPSLDRSELPSTRLPTAKKIPDWELDLRGLRADEAIETIDRYLDSALFAGLPFVRLIHGKGSGRLRQVIREHLRKHPHIVSFEGGEEREGGEGVTIVKLN